MILNFNLYITISFYLYAQGQEYGLFEADRQRLANPQLAAESTVDLNVGGTLAFWPSETSNKRAAVLTVLMVVHVAFRYSV